MYAIAEGREGDEESGYGGVEIQILSRNLVIVLRLLQVI